MKRSTLLFFLLIVAVVGTILLNLSGYSNEPDRELIASDASRTKFDKDTKEFHKYGLQTDTSRSAIPLAKVLSGGVEKDGIPALNNPSFTSLSQTEYDNATEGVLVSLENEHRFYPLNILVWHEIVNDRIAKQAFAVTFCPLCDSVIVLDRMVQGITLQFGVSGLLFESNLLMYDTVTESLWSQARREAVIGSYTGELLSVLPAQRLTLAEVKERYPSAVVLSSETGFDRPYGTNPYDNYLEHEEVYFPISVHDERYPAKELFYVLPFPSRSFALQYQTIPQGVTTIPADSYELRIERKGSEITITDENGTILPGYFELWFSWAVHHQEDGVVLTLDVEK